MRFWCAAALILLGGRAWGAAPVTFAVIGDYGSGTPNEADVAALVNSWNPDFICTVGDNNYPSGSASTIDAAVGQFFHQYIYNYAGSYGAGSDVPRFFPVAGNHDYYNATQDAQPYIDYFDLPGTERYYSFSRGPVDFFMLNSDSREPDGATAGSVQADWAREAMAASTARWKLVMFHHAPYSSGSVHGSTERMRWPFAAWGASAVLSGHDHTYERLLVDGIPYFVNGIGGSSIYGFASPPLDESVIRYSGNYGAMKVTASDASLHFQFITRTPTICDDYSLDAAISAWTGTGGQWADPANWSNGAAPGDGADVTLAATQPETTIGYAESGTGQRLARLAVDAGGSGQLVLQQSSDTLSVRSLLVAPESGSGRFYKTGGLLEADNVHNSGVFEHLGGTLILHGSFYNAAGSADLGGTLQFDTDAWLIAAGGSVRLSADGGAAAPLTVKIRLEATVQFDASQHLELLELTGGSATVTGNAALVTAALTIDPTATLDLGLGSLILFNSDAAPELDALVFDGRLHTSQIGRSIAVFDNQILHLTAWGSEPLYEPRSDFNQVLAVSALIGDVNLDGAVTELDFLNVVANQGTAGSWLQGDVDHNGQVTPDDFARVGASLGAGAPPAAGPLLAGGGSAQAAAVPEPVLGGWLLAVATSVLRRRTRRGRISAPARRNG